MRLNLVGDQDYHAIIGSEIPCLLTVIISFFCIYYMSFLIGNITSSESINYTSTVYDNTPDQHNDHYSDLISDINISEYHFLPFLEIRLQNFSKDDFSNYDIFEDDNDTNIDSIWDKRP